LSLRARQDEALYFLQQDCFVVPQLAGSSYNLLIFYISTRCWNYNTKCEIEVFAAPQLAVPLPAGSQW